MFPLNLTKVVILLNKAVAIPHNKAATLLNKVVVIPLNKAVVTLHTNLH
jgi:hypothetical protein